MPSTSKKQHNLMAAVANSPAFAKKAGIPQRVGADFMKADKGRKFAKGGDMAKKMPPFMGKETKAEEAKEMKVKAKSFALYKKGEKAEGVHGKSGMEKPTKYAKGGFTSCADGVAKQGKTKAQQFADGGMASPAMAQPVGMAPRPRFGMASPAMAQPVGGTLQPGGAGQQGTNPSPSDSVKIQQAQQMQQAARKAQQMQQMPIMPRKNVPLGPPPTGAAMGPAPTSSARPTNPFTNPKQYKAEYQAEMAKQKQKSFAKPQGGKAPSFDGTPLDTRYRGNDGDPAKNQQFRQQQTLERQRAMAEQRKGGFNMSPEAKQKLGESLGKMMGNVRAKGAKAMASRGGTGFNAPNMMDDNTFGAKKGGAVKKFASGGSIDGCATKGKTKGKGRIF